MTPRMMNAAATVSAQSRSAIDSRAANPRMVDFATLGRAPARLGLGSRRLTSRDLQIAEASDELLAAEVPDPEGVASTVSFLKGFNATIPSAEQGRSRRRQTRNVDAPRLGLKKREQKARGLLGDDEGSVISEEDAVLVNGRRGLKPKRGRQSLAAGKTLGKAELKRQTSEIMNDKENINVRRVGDSFGCIDIDLMYNRLSSITRLPKSRRKFKFLILFAISSNKTS
jgi:division protein 1